MTEGSRPRRQGRGRLKNWQHRENGRVRHSNVPASEGRGGEGWKTPNASCSPVAPWPTTPAPHSTSESEAGQRAVRHAVPQYSEIIFAKR